MAFEIVGSICNQLMAALAQPLGATEADDRGIVSADRGSDRVGVEDISLVRYQRGLAWPRDCWSPRECFGDGSDGSRDAAGAMIVR